MRRLFAGFLLTFAALGGGTASGQIKLLPGPQQPVPAGSQQIAAGFVDHDQFEDVVVDSDTANQATLIFGQADATAFASSSTLGVTGVLRGLAVGDLDFPPNGNADLAITSMTQNKVFTISGNGNRSFQTNFPSWSTDSTTQTGLRGRGPVDVAIADFDHRNGNDMAVVNQASDTVTVLLNQGATINTGTPFTNVQLYAVGMAPKRIATADMNTDGFADILEVNTGTGGADSVGLLLNDPTTPSDPFRRNALRSILAGAGAADFAVSDFNDDGIPDLAVLNAQIIGSQTTFTVSILINQVVSGKGTGFFTAMAPIQLGCVTTIDGIEVVCTPNFIAAGDFDGDGFNDFAFTIDTHPRDTNNSTKTPGMVVAYKGRGNGLFDFSDQEFVGNNPQSIVTLDFNGDLIDDVAIVEVGSQSARILAAQPPAPLNNGEVCHKGKQCASTFCVKDDPSAQLGVCCNMPSCSDDKVCDVPGSPTLGQCSPPAPNGHTCTDGANGTVSHQCLSTSCVDGFCCSSLSCPPVQGVAQFCNTGDCGPPADIKTPCNDDAQCALHHCTDSVCCTEDRCQAGQACDIPGLEGSCASKLDLGQPCTLDQQCAPLTETEVSGFCTDGICCRVDACPQDQSCGIAGHEGLCFPLPTATPTPTSTPTPTLTPTPQPPGFPCLTNSMCNDVCLNGYCCVPPGFPAVRVCPAGEFCNISDSLGSCAPKKDNGSTCGSDQDCKSNNCPDGTCQPPFTPTPTPTPLPGPGSSCSTATDCRADLFCTNRVCCVDAQCDEQHGQFCNVTGFEGACHGPVGINFPCKQNSDCDTANGVTCQFCTTGLPDCPTIGEKFCQLSTTPTPFIPTPKPTPTQIFVSARSGGCAIDNRGDGGSVWLLAALPLLFGLRRARLQRVRARNQ